MFANKTSQIKETTVEQQKERLQNANLRETVKKINLQVINEDDQFEVDPEIFTE